MKQIQIVGVTTGDFGFLASLSEQVEADFMWISLGFHCSLFPPPPPSCTQPPVGVPGSQPLLPNNLDPTRPQGISLDKMHTWPVLLRILSEILRILKHVLFFQDTPAWAAP